MTFNPRHGHYFYSVYYLRETYTGRPESLGVTWKAEPLCDAPRGLLALDLHVVTFDSNYYGTAKGICKNLHILQI